MEPSPVVESPAVRGTFGLWGEEGVVFNACKVHAVICSCTCTPSLLCYMEGGGISASWALLWLWRVLFVAPSSHVTTVTFWSAEKQPPCCAHPPLSPDPLLHGGIVLKRWWIWKCLNYSMAGEQECHLHVKGCKSWVMFKVCQAAIQKWAGSGSKNGSEGFRHSVCAGLPCWALAALYLCRTTHPQSLGQAFVCSGRAVLGGPQEPLGLMAAAPLTAPHSWAGSPRHWGHTGWHCCPSDPALCPHVCAGGSSL